MGTLSTTRAGAATLMAVYIAGMLFVFLSPAEVPVAGEAWLVDVFRQLGTPESLLVTTRFEFVANVLIVVPATVLGALVWPATNWRDWTAYGFVFSAGVELTQRLPLAGRSSQFIDIVANTLGAFAGAALVGLILRMRERT